ncbi:MULTISPECIES: hypothetical protein [Natronorubrum]|nr:hypothetical protein [Natronorubrum bangense]
MTDTRTASQAAVPNRLDTTVANVTHPIASRSSGDVTWSTTVARTTVVG